MGVLGVDMPPLHPSIGVIWMVAWDGAERIRELT
jgi:hypothetical protein